MRAANAANAAKILVLSSLISDHQVRFRSCSHWILFLPLNLVLNPDGLGGSGSFTNPGEISDGPPF